MSDDIDVQPASAAAERQHAQAATLTQVNTALLAVVMLAAVLAVVLLMVLSNDVSRLDEHLRRSLKATKALEQEVAELRARLPPAAPSASAAPSVQNAPAIPRNIDAADPARDCVIRPGGKDGIAHCL